MTSVLPDDENNVTRLKRKSHSVLNKQCSDESRTFLAFSRENLSMSSCSELEQGFNRTSSSSSSSSRLRCCCLCKKQTMLSCAALILALSCAVLELWKVRKVAANARDIQEISRDVEGLKHRFLEKDLLDELRAFEEQLYGSNDEENNESAGSNGDYDSNYDDSTTPQSTTTTTSSASTTTRPCTSKDLADVLAVLRRAETEQNARQRERLLEEERQKELRRMSSEHRIINDVAQEKKKKRDVNFHTRLKEPAKK